METRPQHCEPIIFFAPRGVVLAQLPQVEKVVDRHVPWYLRTGGVLVVTNPGGNATYAGSAKPLVAGGIGPLADVGTLISIAAAIREALE